MEKNKKKLLVVSMHLGGGCFHYSNEIMSRMHIDRDLYIPEITCEKHSLTDYKTLKFYGYNNIRRYLSLFVFLIKIFWKGIIGRYNALLLFGYTSWDYYFVRVWKLTGRKVYFVVHDGKLHIGEENDLNQSRLLYIMKQAHNLIFLSEYVRNMIRLSYGIDKPYHIAPHGLIDYGAADSVDHKKPVLLFLGRISRYKGIELLIDSLKYIPDVYEKLIIAGKWEYAVPDISDRRIEIVDKWLSEDEIVDFISKADIMLFPYIEATQSGVATLAINYLKPVVAFNVGAFKEQFDNTSALLIDTVDAESFADGITRLCVDEGMRVSMKSAMRKLREKYSWDCIASDLIEYINSTVDK